MDGLLGRRVAVGSPTLVGMLVYALLRCVCAAADGGEHTPRVVAPAPVITAGRLFQRARLRNNHGANSAYLIEVAVMSTARTS
jgi:hypothetical protein